PFSLETVYTISVHVILRTAGCSLFLDNYMACADVSGKRYDDDSGRHALKCSHVCTGCLQPAAADNDGEISGAQKLDLFHSRIRNDCNSLILDRRPHLDVDRRLYDGYSARRTVLCSTDAAAR